MDLMSGEILSTFGNFAQVMTGFIAVLAYGSYLAARYRRRKKIEAFMRLEGEKLGGRLVMSVEQLAAAMWMTPEQILEAIFSSRGHLLTQLDPGAGPTIWSRMKVTYMTHDQLRRSKVRDA